MTHMEKIMHAVARLVKNEGKSTFSRREVRDKLGLTQEEWMSGYTSIFQGMRIDQPGGAPDVGARFKGVFRQVSHGVHTLTGYGKELLNEFDF